jgi:predicted AAA+ superfamily ATPase
MRVQNPWWQTGETDKRKDLQFRRGEYYLCGQVFWHKIRRFPVLSGPRRVGKSTIVHQMIGDLLASGVNPLQILYLSLDTSAMEEAGILKLLMIYQSQISQSEDFYLFVDEVQKDDDWTSAMKFIYDDVSVRRGIQQTL